MKKSESCPECHGKGWVDLCLRSVEEARACGLCHGTGSTPTGRDCHGCHGTGRIEVRTMEQQRCMKCNGTGLLYLPEDL